MIRYRTILLLIVVLVLGVLVYQQNRADAPSQSIVTQKADASRTDCSAYKDATIILRYTIAGMEKGFCVNPASQCALDARIGQPLPEACLVGG